MGISIYQFNANLLGKSKFNIDTGRGSQLSVAFLNSNNKIFDFWDSDTFGADNIFASNTGKRDGFVDAYLDGFRVGNNDWEVDGSDNGHIVLGSLGNLFAVFAISSVSTISSMTVSMVSWCAYSDHLYIFFFGECHLNSSGNGIFSLLLIFVSTDFLGDDFNGFSTDSTGDGITLFFVNDDFGENFNISTDSFEGGCAHFSSFSNIYNCAVIFGFFVTISVMGVAISGSMVNRSGMVRSRGGVIRCRGWFWVVDWCRCWVVWCRCGMGMSGCGMGNMVTSVGSQFSMVIFMAVSMSRDFDERTNVSKCQHRQNSQNNKCLKDKEDIKKDRPNWKIGAAALYLPTNPLCSIYNLKLLFAMMPNEVKRRTH